MSEKFTHAGVSTLNGKTKVRFANDAARVKVLAKNGHKDIDMVELKQASTKYEALEFLIKINFANGNATVQTALDEAQAKRAPKAGNKDRPGKEKKKPKQNKPKKAAAKVVSKPVVEVVDSEDVPF